MRIAVTGATGLLGHQVCRAAVDAGHDVVAVVRDRTAPLTAALTAYPGVTGRGSLRLARADLRNRASLSRAFAGAEGLVHCAAVYAFGAGRAESIERANCEGTRSVLEAGADAGLARVIVTSSSVTCGSSTSPTPRTEADRLGLEPAPAYYRSKVAQEHTALQVAAERDLAVVLALPTLILGGPYTTLAPSNAIVLRYLLDPTRSTFAGGGNVVDVRDVAVAHLVLLTEGVAGERYLLGGDNLTWRALHALVADLAGLPGPFLHLPAPVVSAVSAAGERWAEITGGAALATAEEATTVGRYYWYSCARAASLGYAARPAREAVAASLAWLLVGPDLPRWVREGLRVAPEVRAARALTPRQLPHGTTDAGAAAAPARRVPGVRTGRR
ncbi:MAG: NAD-dependent epimerase/dehydratase family protein [Dermatophilaceae bacterium]